MIVIQIRALIPNRIKLSLRQIEKYIDRRLKAPKMLIGYLDSSGNWRSRTRISDTAFIYHPERIVIEDNVFVGHYTIIDGTAGVEIGEGSQFAAWSGVFSHSSHIAIRLYGRHYLEVPEHEKKGYQLEQVKIGKYVFIGAGSLIFPGVTIGDGALVNAGSIVKEDVRPFEIVSGNPAVVVGDARDLDREFLDDMQIKSWYEEWKGS